MVPGKLGAVLQRLRQMVQSPETSADGELLRRFAETGDESAFTALVQRHAPLVLGVCRRVLGDSHDADDACQATFLVLFRKAPSLDRRGSLAGWLHTVGHRVALKARARGARRRVQERQVDPMPDVPAETREMPDDLRPLLDEELHRLPEKFRLPLVLCYLSGKTQEEAARELGCTPDAVRGRLARGRDRLRSRLAQRGMALSAPALALALAEQAAADLAAGSGKFAPSILQLARGSDSPAVSLAEGVLHDMFLSKLKSVAVLLLAVGVTLGGASALAYRFCIPDDVAAANEPANPAEETPDPVLPKGALRRFELGDAVNHAVVSPDGKLLAAADNYKHILVWDLASGKQVADLKMNVEPPPGEAVDPNRNASRLLPRTIFAFSPDGQRIAAVGGGDWTAGRCVQIWNARTGQEVERLWADCESFAFSPDGRSLALLGLQRRISVRELATHQERLAINANGSLMVRGISFLPDGKFILLEDYGASSVTGDYLVWHCDLASGKPREMAKIKGVKRVLRSLVPCPLNDRVATQEIGQVQIWDLTADKEMTRFQPDGGEIIASAFSADGKRLALLIDSKTVILKDVATGKTVGTVEGRATSVALTPDGKSLVTGDDKGRLLLWPVP